jgi:arsenate reductase
MITVLFVCGRNAGRSQMAEALCRSLAPDRIRAESAGTTPATRIQPLAVEAMNEIGVSMDGMLPKTLTPAMLAGADLIVTMGCGVACPAGFAPSEDWGLDDPHGRDLASVRAIRDQIRARIEELLDRLDPAHASQPKGESP